MEHHYLITDDLPELVTRQRELPLVVDLDGELYMRQERHGVLLGGDETPATPWAAGHAVGPRRGAELLAPQLERLTGSLEKGFTRFPTLNTVGIRGWSMARSRSRPMAIRWWVRCRAYRTTGVRAAMAGFAQAGGVGLALAQC
jgi:dimethylglycine dehydrogenase